jgi:hypothetical protein
VAYIPDPTLVTQPLETVDASTAAAEFRALKAYIASLAGLASPVGFTAFKNKIINGNGFVDQRRAGTAAIATAATVFGSDRWRVTATGAGTLQLQRITAGQFSALRCTVNTADAALAGTDSYYFLQPIEGYNIADLLYGLAGAKTTVLQFRAKSSIAGTHSGSIINATAARSYVFTFILAAANVEQDFFIVIPGDSTGVPNVINGLGLAPTWNMGQDVARLTTSGSWQAGVFYGATGSIQLVSTVNSYLEITNVQLEAGLIATTYEQQPFDVELLRSMRYYEKSFQYATVPAQNTGIFLGASEFGQYVGASTTCFLGLIPWKVNKRTAPVTVQFNPAAANNQMRNGTTAADWSATGLFTISERGAVLQATSAAGSAAGNEAALHWTADAEL